jgi:hypothetical protein
MGLDKARDRQRARLPPNLRTLRVDWRENTCSAAAAYTGARALVHLSPTGCLVRGAARCWAALLRDKRDVTGWCPGGLSQAGARERAISVVTMATPAGMEEHHRADSSTAACCISVTMDALCSIDSHAVSSDRVGRQRHITPTWVQLHVSIRHTHNLSPPPPAPPPGAIAL